MKFSELVEKLSLAYGQPLFAETGTDPEITAVAAIDQAFPGSLSYIDGGKFASRIKTTTASALILPKDPDWQAQATAQGMAWVEAPYPRLLFAQAIALFYQPYKPTPAIHPTAVIDPAAEIGQDVAIGAHVVIQAGAKIGNQVCIHPNVVVYPEALVGDRTTLHANCVIHERARVGADCVIHAGAVVGSEGFGFVPIPTGWYKMEQSGYVVLEDGVEIGCNSTIDRPAVGETRIARNTKLDNMVHIGHGCEIGQDCAIAAQTGMAGGVKVGNRVLIGGQVGIANQAVVGDGAQIAAQAGVHGDVKPGTGVAGSPAVAHPIYLKSSAIYARLPELYHLVKQIQKQLGLPTN